MWVSVTRTIVALVLVVALSACDEDQRPRRAEPIPVTPIPAQSPTRPPSPFADLPRGHPPTIGYVDHYVHIAPDGTRTRLPPVADWRRETAILRFDAHGHVELAAPATRSRGWSTGYVLDAQP